MQLVGEHGSQLRIERALLVSVTAGIDRDRDPPRPMSVAAAIPIGDQARAGHDKHVDAIGLQRRHDIARRGLEPADDRVRPAWCELVPRVQRHQIQRHCVTFILYWDSSGSRA